MGKSLVSCFFYLLTVYFDSLQAAVVLIKGLLSKYAKLII